MRYKWLTIGNSEEEIRKLCMLGPYLLELIEDHWEGPNREEEKLFMAFNVYKWSDETKTYEDIETNLKPKEFNPKKSHKILEDWYACNVLIEDYLGSAD